MLPIVQNLRFVLFFRDKLEMYNKVKNNCNNFFMEIVSQLCFADGEAPANEVIKKLVSFVTFETRMDHGMKNVSKEMALFESKVESTPVLRSSLLQHLLRTRWEPFSVETPHVSWDQLVSPCIFESNKLMTNMSFS